MNSVLTNWVIYLVVAVVFVGIPALLWLTLFCSRDQHDYAQHYRRGAYEAELHVKNERPLAQTPTGNARIAPLVPKSIRKEIETTQAATPAALESSNEWNFKEPPILKGEATAG